MFKIPSIKLPSLPKLALPRISIPKITLPVKLPSLPKIQVPKITLPKITVPKFSIPTFKAPPISIPKITLPVVAAGIGIPAAVGAAGISLLQNKSSLPKIELPKVPDASKAAGDLLTEIVKLPVTVGNTLAVDIPSYIGESVGLISKPAGESIRGIPKAVGNAVSSIPKAVDDFVSGKSIAGVELAKTNPSQIQPNANIIDDVINVRDSAYESGITKVMLGSDTTTKAAGVVETALPAAADVLLPLDAMNVGNKLATGRIGEITQEDVLWAAVDVGLIIAGVFSGGLAYGAGRAIKTGLKGGKIMSIAKIGSVLSNLKSGRKATSAALKQQAAIKAAVKQQAATTAALKQQKAIRAAVKQQTATRVALNEQAAIRAAIKERAAIEGVGKSLKSSNAYARVAKVADASEGAVKAGGSSISKMIGVGALSGVSGWMLGGLLSGTPQAEPYQEEEPLYDTELYDPYAGYDESLWDGLLPEESYMNEAGYYEPMYPTFEPLEYAAQDVAGALESLPIAGDFFGEMKERGLALPAILIAGGVVFGGGYLFLTKTKAGRDLMKKAKSTVGKTAPKKRSSKKGAAA